MREEIIRNTQEFLREKISVMVNYEDNTERLFEYRIEHSHRVAHICAEIARNEGFDEERAFVAGLLHDIGYAVDYKTSEDFKNHGRYGAAIARPFLLSIGYTESEVNEICYGIAIHVDDKADFECERTPLALCVGDADNIDRFDAYRLYEKMSLADFVNLSIAEQEKYADRMLEGLKKMLSVHFESPTSAKMWEDRINFQLEYFKRLKHQFEISF